MIARGGTIDLSGQDGVKRHVKPIANLAVIAGKDRDLSFVMPPKEKSTLYADWSWAAVAWGSTKHSCLLNWRREAELARSLNRRVDDFLNEVYFLDNAGQTESATFRVFDFLEEKLFVGELEFCDTVLKRADENRLSTSLMRSFLVISAPAKEKLSERAGFYARVSLAMLRLRGPEITKRLIGTLG
jgi:hypothetical protein